MPWVCLQFVIVVFPDQTYFLLLHLYSARSFSVDTLGERVEYLVSVFKEGLEALYCLSMHDLLFKMVPLNNCFYENRVLYLFTATLLYLIFPILTLRMFFH